MSFPAGYASRCAECDLSIFVDDLISMTPDGAVHEGCEPSTTAPAKKSEPTACPVCWLFHPEGACDR